MIGKVFPWLLVWLVMTVLFYVVCGLLSLAIFHYRPSPTRLVSWQTPALVALIASLPTKQWGERRLRRVQRP